MDNAPIDHPSLNERFLLVIDQLGLSGYAIDKEGPVSAATIVNIRSGKNKPNSELLVWLLINYPQVNAEYLMRGEGTPLGRVGTTIYNQGTNNTYNYKSKTRSGAGAKELEQQQVIIDGLQRENQLLRDMIDLLRGPAPVKSEADQTAPAGTDL